MSMTNGSSESHYGESGDSPTSEYGVTSSIITPRNGDEKNNITHKQASRLSLNLNVLNSPLTISQPNMHYQHLSQNASTASSFSSDFASSQAGAVSPSASAVLDLDRDVTGVLLPLHLYNHLFLVPSNGPLANVSNSDEKPFVPANSYTSPKRIERVIQTSSASFKRKRPELKEPPAAYVYVRTDNPGFNIFANGFLLYPELCFALASQMLLRDLISLYAISKDFHVMIDSRFTTVCLVQALRKAPESAQVFRFRSYKELCRCDPTARIPHPDPKKAADRIPRQIPSFRWVAFVLHREKVVQELMAVFAERGCPLPAGCGLALKRMWAMLDIPDNARRIAMIHNSHLLTDVDLCFLMCFFVKLDMIAHDPVAFEKRDGLRKLLLCQKGGLDVMLKVLKREMWRRKSDFIAAWVHTNMNVDNIPAEALEADGVLGVPKHLIGIGKFEYWGQRGVFDESTGRKRPYLLRPDQLVMREAVRRGMTLSKHFLRCVLYGYVRPDTLENYEPRDYGRRLAAWKGEEYEVNDSVGGVRALDVGDGGDPLLDLGDCHRGSQWTIQKEQIYEQERSMRAGQDGLLSKLYEAVEKERQLGAK